MAKVAIITDSNSGITQNEAKKLGIGVIPMPFMIDGEEYFEDINLSQEQFYNLIKNDASVCTSQPATGVISQMWDDYLKTYDEIIYIPMSSGLSMSCRSALILAESDKFKNRVFVVDNQRISVTQLRSVMDALEMAKMGMSASEIRDNLLKYKAASTIYIMVDTLKYLKKGGRITPAVALIGSLLKVKPILQIHGEKLDKFKQSRTLANAKRIMLDQVKEDIENQLSFDGRKDNIHFDVAYTYNREEALVFAEEIKKEFGVEDVIVNPLSLSVSCHIGPGSLAIAATKKLIL